MQNNFLDRIIIKRTQRKKTISISIKEGNVIVLSPKLISQSYLNDLLKKKKNWIERKLKEEKGKRAIQKRLFLEGEKFLKFGKEKTLIYKKSALTKVEETNNSIIVYCLQQKDIKKLIEAWYKDTLNIYLREKLDFFKELMNLDYNSFIIKLYKNRLGSCSYSGNLSFNWKIAMMPYDIINYIIIHELSHLKYFNHSKEFWKLVEKFCPDYKEKKNWIKENKSLIFW